LIEIIIIGAKMQDYIIKKDDLQGGLKSLRTDCPGLNPSVYEFAEYLAERITSEKTPYGFGQAIENTILVLSLGKELKNGKAIIHPLAKQEPQVYNILRINLQGYLSWVLPAEFARGVNEYYSDMAKLKAK